MKNARNCDLPQISLSLAPFLVIALLLPFYANAAPWKDTSPFVISYITILAIKHEIDPALALSIIWCESKMKMGAIGTLAKVGKDYGGFQINSYWHRETMEKMGLDIERSEDSLIYGVYLLKMQGEKPWRASRRCWQAGTT